MQGFCEVAISNQHFILRREPSEDLRLLLTKNSNCTFNIRCEVANAEGYVGPGFLTINVANSVMLISLGDYVLFLAFCRLAALPCLSHQTLQIKGMAYSFKSSLFNVENKKDSSPWEMESPSSVLQKAFYILNQFCLRY